MPTFNITPTAVHIGYEDGSAVIVQKADGPSYEDAVSACLRADWDELETIIFTPADRGYDEDDGFSSIGDSRDSIASTLDEVKGWIEDGLVSPEDLITENNLDLFAEAMPAPPTVSHEHDLSNWRGSPIFYPTREMARAQSNRWGMFWDYHDFGIASPVGYRYATVPRGIGPTAPEGYDWVCLPREES